MNIWSFASKIPFFKNKLLYEPSRVSFYGYTYKSFDGYMNEITLAKEMHKFYPDFKIVSNFILKKDDIIIHPSIRSEIIGLYFKNYPEMVKNNKSFFVFSEYAKYIYDETPPIFVGTYKEYNLIMKRGREFIPF